MNERNIHMMDIIVDKLAHGKTISKALKTVYNKRNVIIPFDESINGVEILKLGMSPRTSNVLMRNRLNTVGKVIEFATTETLYKARGLGINSGIELLEAILDWSWNHMDHDKKVQFLIDVVERNEDNIKAELM